MATLSNNSANGRNEGSAKMTKLETVSKELFGEMREATKEERDSIDQAIQGKSVEIEGFNFFSNQLKEEKIRLELSKSEVQRLFEYMDEGIDDWFKYHQEHEGMIEFDFALKARLENALYMVTKEED